MKQLIPLLLLTLSLSAPIQAQHTTISWPDATWPLSSPAAEGIHADTLAAIHADIQAGHYGLMDHFLLIRHGRVVADHHYTHHYPAAALKDTASHAYNYDHPHWHPFYHGTALHSLQSVTKSVTSAILGLAVDRGLLEDIDAPVMRHFSSFKQDWSDTRRSAVTLKDLLTMRSGIAWDEAHYDNAKNSCVLMETSKAWLPFVLSQPMSHTPGRYFNYNSGVSVLLGKRLRLATGERIDTWAEQHLFKPLGIRQYHWKITPDGEADTEGGLYLAPHDLARIGYLFLRKGLWKGERILSEAWIEASTTPWVKDPSPDDSRSKTGYGYQWWMPFAQAQDIYAAMGYGGQYLIVSPRHDLVLVLNAWNIHGESKRDARRILTERILPALRL